MPTGRAAQQYIAAGRLHKRTDLPFFLNTICHMSYEHRPELAPTLEMLQEYRGAMERLGSICVPVL